MSSKVNSSRRISSASSALVSRELVEHVALGRAVGVVEDVGERLDAAGGRVLLRDDARELLLHDGLDLRDDLGPRLAHRARRARRRRPAPRARAATSTCAASVVCRLATTSAIVCGDSLRRKTWICSGGVRRRNSNGRRSIVAARRAMISSARVGAERALEHLAREVDAALGEVVLGEHGLDDLGERRPGRRRRAPCGALAISSESASISVSAEVREDLGGALLAERDEQDRGLLDPRRLERSTATARRRDGERSVRHRLSPPPSTA